MKAILLAALCAAALQERMPSRVYRILPGHSRASYAVDEVFLRENNRLFTAVGASTALAGEVVLGAGGKAATVREIVIDLRTLTSDSPRRDRALRERFLESNRFPHARLTNAVVSGLSPSIFDGAGSAFDLEGDLTVRGVTRRTRWRGTARVVQDTLRGTAATTIDMDDFGIEVPRLLWLRAEDNARLEIRFVAVQQGVP